MNDEVFEFNWVVTTINALSVSTSRLSTHDVNIKDQEVADFVLVTSVEWDLGV